MAEIPLLMELLSGRGVSGMLELQNISWNAPGGMGILRNLSLQVPDRKLLVITGPNGGGKTTLAKIIAGIQKPDSGKVILDGEDITGLDVTERAKRGISFAFQQPVRFKGITVRRLIELASGGTLPEEKTCEVLGRVGLCAKDYIDREVDATLSGGEIKRIEIATVLARHTKLSIFDEPEAGIDLWSFSKLIDVFEDFRHTLKGTLIIISHQERILKIADEIAVISGGKVAEIGPSVSVLPRLLGQKESKETCGFTRQDRSCDVNE